MLMPAPHIGTSDKEVILISIDDWRQLPMRRSYVFHGLGLSIAATLILALHIFPCRLPVQDGFTLYDGPVTEAIERPLRIEMRVKHSSTDRHYDVILPATRSPRGVILTGKALSEIKDSNSRAGETGWRMSSDSRTVHVLFQSNDFDLKVER
jgi:hypothetical protein